MDLTTFTALVSESGGLARPNKFGVSITVPKVLASLEAANKSSNEFNDAFDTNIEKNLNEYFKILDVADISILDRLDFYCERAELPGMGFDTDTQRLSGPTFKIPYNDQFFDITLYFYVGRNMKEKDFFDAWMYSIKDPITGYFNYLGEYSTEIYISQYDEFDNITYQVKLIDAWPIFVNNVYLSYQENNTVHKLPITFTFKKWVNTGVDYDSSTNTPERGQHEVFRKTITPPKK